MPESFGAAIRSDALINETLPLPDIKLSSAIEDPPPPHDVSASTINGKIMSFFIFISLVAINEQQVLSN
jgi:hypothetical protein